MMKDTLLAVISFEIGYLFTIILFSTGLYAIEILVKMKTK